MIQNFVAPNWKDEAAYPIAKDTKPTRWAWEFLRRNKDYQEDWRIFADAVMAKAREHPETLKYAEFFLNRDEESWAAFAAQFTEKAERDEAFRKHADTIFDLHDGPLMAFDPPLASGESYTQYKQRVQKWTRSPLGYFLGRKWGLDSLVNPNSLTVGGPSGVRFNQALGSGWFMPNVDFRSDLNRFDVGHNLHFTREEFAVHFINGLGELLGKPELKTITFNLALPIDEQVDAVRAHLKAHARIRSEAGEMEILPQPRYEARMYRNYLRAFDAKHAGARPGEIVNALLPKEAKKNNAAYGYSANAKVKHWIKQAEFLVKTGYQFIPLAANKADKAKRKKLRR